MIGKLIGTVDELFTDSCILNVNNVGYIIYCSTKTLDQLDLGINVSLLIDMHVREDTIILFGFNSPAEKIAFRHLISVQGVGGRMGLTILSIFDPQELIDCISRNDTEMMQRVSGVGKKLAARIITELSGNKNFATMQQSITQHQNSPNSTTSKANSIFNDTLTAMLSLGFNRSTAQNVIKEVMQEQGQLSTEEVLRISISRMNK